MKKLDNTTIFNNIKRHFNFLNFFLQKSKVGTNILLIRQRYSFLIYQFFVIYISFIFFFYFMGLFLSFIFIRTIWFIKKENKIIAVGVFILLFYFYIKIFFLFLSILVLFIYINKIFFFNKYTLKVDIIQLPTLMRCKVLIAINVVVFVCYKFLLYFDFIFDYVDVRMFLFICFCYSIHICYKDIVEYMLYYNPDAFFKIIKKIDKAVRYFMYNLSFTSSVVIMVGRFLGQIFIESISLRYGVNGFMLRGGFGIIQSACETPEQHMETAKTFGATPYPIVIHTESLPEVPPMPPKNVCEFIATVANHPVDLNVSPHDAAYERQFNIFKENNFFKKRFGEDWKEFKSCIRGILLDAKHTGEVNYNIMITKKQVADFIDTKGRPIQVKTKFSVTTVEIEEILKDQRVKEAVIKDNMLLHFFLERGVKGDIGSLRDTVKPYILKKNVILTNLMTAPRASPQDAEEVLLYPKYNKNYTRECNFLMKTGGYEKCAPYMANIKKIMTKGR